MWSYVRAYVRKIYEIPLKTSRGLKWENKTYKLERSVETPEDGSSYKLT